MASNSGQSCQRHTLTDVIFFDLEELQTESALIPSVLPAATPSLAPPPRPSSPQLTLLRQGHLPSLRPSPTGASLRPSTARAASPSARHSSPRLSGTLGCELSVSILTYATSDAAGLMRKLENTLAMCRSSKHKTEIIIGCDGADDSVLEVARAYEAQGVRVLSWRKQVGPLATWAQVTHASRHDVVLFTDVDARMAPDTLDQLLFPLRDANVGMTVPSYVPCVKSVSGVRARLDAATHGITAASYAGVAVRRRLLRRPAHDTVQPGLVTALQVLGRGHRVVSLPSVRVFHPEVSSARASFAQIAQRTQGQLQAALRQREALLAQRKGMFFGMLREGLKHVPALAGWLGCMLALLLFGFGLLALLTFSAGAAAIASANWKLARFEGLSRLDRLGATLTAGAAQAYGMVRFRS